jgi:hypothetical protein
MREGVVALGAATEGRRAADSQRITGDSSADGSLFAIVFEIL